MSLLVQVDYDAPTQLAKPVQEHIQNYLAPKANRRIKRAFAERNSLAKRKLAL
jgi:hypothetical protein